MSATRKITESALLIALAIVFQSLRFISPAIMGNLAGVFVIGSLVNLVIFVAIGRVGFGGAALVSIITPLVAVLEGHLPNILLAPAVIIGNLIIAFVWWLLNKKLNLVSQTITVFIASILKFLFLWWAVPWTFVTFLYGSWSGNADKTLSLLYANMSWPQLVTGIIGGLLAVVVLRVLPKRQ